MSRKAFDCLLCAALAVGVFVGANAMMADRDNWMYAFTIAGCAGMCLVGLSKLLRRDHATRVYDH